MKITDQKFQTFYPNVYSPAEQEALDGLRKSIEEAGGVGFMANRTLVAKEEKMLDYARLWNPYDPLYNDPEYAAKTRWGKLPALPCCIFGETISGFPMMDDIADDMGNVFYYANDGGDIVYRGFREGVVYLTMQGACSGCPSSSATLKHGIQNLLRHFLPDVREVEAI